MSKNIVIKNHKAFVIHDPNEKDHPITESETDTLLPYLNCDIDVEENVIFDDIWRLIEKDQEVYNIIFKENLGSFPLEIYINQFKKPCRTIENEDPENCMKCIEAYWEIDLETWKGKNSLNICPSLHGWGMQKCPDSDGNETVSEGGWSLSFTPINDYKGYPFRIKDSGRLFHQNLDKNKQLKNNLIFETIHIQWTVYDMLSAIFFEISFFGTPDNQMKRLQEIDQTVQGIKDGSVELVEGMDVFKNILEEENLDIEWENEKDPEQ